MNTKGTLIALVAACVAAVAIAGITSTPQAPQYLIRLADKTYEKGTKAPVSQEECYRRAQAILPHADCVTIAGFDNVGDCSDVPKPQWEILKDADGFLIKPSFRSKFKDGSDTEFVHEVEDYVGAPYPQCWVKGWRVAMESDFNDETETEYANSVEPVPMTPTLQAAWNASCAERHAAHVYYEGDTCD